MAKFFRFLFFLLFVSVSAEILLRLQEPFFHFVRDHDVSQEVSFVSQMYVPHPYWDHAFRPGLKKLFADTGAGGRECLLEINEQGFRHPVKIAKEKPADVFRVFVLGDSFTEGPLCGPSISHWIQKKLELRHPGRRFEVINAGVASHSPVLYIIRLRREIFSYSPDLVVVNIDQTDVNDDLRHLPTLKTDEKGIPWEISLENVRFKILQSKLRSSQALLELSRYSYLVRVVWNIWLLKTQIASDLERMRPWWFVEPERAAILGDYEWIKKSVLSPGEEKGYKEWLRFPEILWDLGKEAKVPVLLTAFPHPGQFGPGKIRWVSRGLAEIAERKKEAYYDAYEDLLKAGAPGNYYVPGDIHFNIEGTRLWGEGLGDFISKKYEYLLSFSL